MVKIINFKIFPEIYIKLYVKSAMKYVMQFVILRITVVSFV